jgi:hypothetical protein
VDGAQRAGHSDIINEEIEAILSAAVVGTKEADSKVRNVKGR